jgi:hypothetical protein
MQAEMVPFYQVSLLLPSMGRIAEIEKNETGEASIIELLS